MPIEAFDVPTCSVRFRLPLRRPPRLRRGAESVPGSQEFLAQRLAQLAGELGLPPSHFLCGISQVAIGSDAAFTRACADGKIPQRILLPQPLDEYITAKGKPSDSPDFTEEQATTARQMTQLPHIIEVRTVSRSEDRSQRFQEASMEILRACDVMIAVAAGGAAVKPGGTLELLDQAAKRGIPALRITASVIDGRAVFEPKWEQREKFELPKLPAEVVPASFALSGAIPESQAYLDALKSHCGTLAKSKKTGFVYSAVFIILLHFTATALASFALVAHSEHWPDWVYIALLSFEIVCLALGMHTHRRFHYSKPGETWATARLIIEVVRSVQSIGRHHLHLRHLFLVASPQSLLSLFRTLDMLHLRGTRANSNGPWIEGRDHYVTHRLLSSDQKMGQIPWYRDEVVRLKGWSSFFRRWFWICTITAVGFTSFKLYCASSHTLHEPSVAIPLLGVLAILLPVAAVGFVSWSIAMGYESREHGYHDTHTYLGGDHLANLRNSLTRGEFEKLLIETETRLLGETVNWFYRQSFAEVV
jgi:hypothetical protein